MLARMQRAYIIHPLLIVMYNESATRENNLAVSFKTKSGLTKQLHSWTFIPEIKKLIFMQELIYNCSGQLYL
jgi:hypothetical protein